MMQALATTVPPQRWRTPLKAAEFRRPSRNVIVTAVTLITVFCAVGFRSLMPLFVLPPVVAVFAFRRSRQRRWAEHDAQREAITALCTALRAELEAGLQPRTAFTSAVWSRPELADLAEEARRPGIEVSLPTLLTVHAARPGRRSLRALAACWYAADRHGIALADAVSGIEEGLRAESARLRATEVELAGIRATILLLAALPIFGFALGLALGADPLNAMLHNTIGQLSLLTGVGLDLLGLLWTDRLVASLRPDEAGRRRQGRVIV
jgi:tight adherence protein B